MRESKQIRISKHVYEYLRKVSEKHQRPMSDCVSDVFDLFESLVEEIEKKNTIVIEGPKNKRSRFQCPILRAMQKRRSPHTR